LALQDIVWWCSDQWVSPVIGECLEGASSNPVSHRCFIEQESLPLLLSTGWLQVLVGYKNWFF